MMFHLALRVFLCGKSAEALLGDGRFHRHLAGWLEPWSCHGWFLSQLGGWFTPLRIGKGVVFSL